MKPSNPHSLVFTLKSPVCFLWLEGNEGKKEEKKKRLVNCLCLIQKTNLPSVYSSVKQQQKL